MSGGTTVRELITKLGFDVDDAKLDQFEHRVATVKTGLIALAAAAAATAAGLFAIAKSASSYGDEIAKSAPILGLTIEAYQKYRYAAALAGVESAEFSTGLQYLARNAGDAAAGSKTLIADFKRLGVSMAMLKKGDVDAIMRQVAVGLQNIPTATERASLSMLLFGRSGLRMGQFLALGTEELDKIGAEAEAFGLFTAESAHAAEEFGDALDRLLFVFEGITHELGIALFPALQGVMDRMREWTLLNKEAIRANLAKFARAAANALQHFIRAMRIVIDVGGKFLRLLGGLENTVKILGVALAATFGGSIVAAVTSLLAVVALLPAGFLAAWAAALWPAALVALAIGAIILVIDDLYTWIQGGDSVLGAWLGDWRAFAEKAKEEFKTLIEGLGVIWDGVKILFSGLWDTMAGAFGILKALWMGDLEGFKKSFVRWAHGLGDTLSGPLVIAFGLVETAAAAMVELLKGAYRIAVGLGKALIPPGLTKLLSLAGHAVGSGVSAAADAFAGLAQPAPALGIPGGSIPFSLARPPASTSGGVQNNVNVQAHVTVPPGTTKQQEDFMKSAMEKIARDAVGREIDHVMQSNPRRE